MWVIEVMMAWAILSLVTTPFIGYFLSEKCRLPDPMLLGIHFSESGVRLPKGEVLLAERYRELINCGGALQASGRPRME